MTTIIKGRTVTRPSVTPIRSTVLDHATVVNGEEHFGLTANDGLWPSYNCLDTFVPTAICPAPTEDKTFTTVGWVPGFEFSVYGAVQCNLVGLDRDDQKSEVERVFAANEGRGVEQALLLNRFVALARDTDAFLPYQAEWEDPVLLGATPVAPAVALAMLEGYARANYSGVPTLHLPAAAASYLGSDKIVWEGDLAYTRLGSKVAIGGGYDPDYSGAWDGTWEMFATGEVYVEKGAAVSVSTYELTGADDAVFDSNTGVALAERSFRVGVDCLVAKATATVAA